MAVTIGGNPITSGQAAEIKAALGITDPATITDSLTELTGSDQFVVLRSGAPYNTTASAVAEFVGVAPAETAPAAITVGQWTATAGDAQVGLNITALPSDGGSAITALQYRLNGGAAVGLTGTGTGERTISSLTNTTAYDIQIRAVNAIGAGEWSDTKTRTPEAVGGGGAGDLTFVKASAVNANFGTNATATFGSNAASGNHILAVVNVANQDTTVSGAGATVDSSPNIGAAVRMWGLRTPAIGSAADAFAYTLSNGQEFASCAIEVSGDAPVFDKVVTATESGGTGDQRSFGITVDQDNSMVLLALSDQNERTWTFGGGLTGINGVSSGAYTVFAWVKLDAGSHNLLFQPNNSTQLNAIAAFVWSPGS